jgi:serine/threonine-protein kinase RsbW
MPAADTLARLEFSSSVDMLEIVGIVTERVGRLARLDDESLHWVTMAVRESVINAVKHGNKSDSSKSVFVEFECSRSPAPAQLTVRVRDQGAGFDPDALADPLTPENVLKSGGRGVFLIRNFMDEVALRRAPEGGMEIRMVKRASPESST